MRNRCEELVRRLDPKVVGLLGVAFSLRLAVVFYAAVHFGPLWFFSRGSEMGYLAASLASGKGFSSPFGVPTGPTAIVAPGYPLLIAAVFRICGLYTCSAALCLMMLHSICNTLTVYLIYRFARAVSDRDSALLVAFFWACSLPLLWMPTIFWETSLSCMLVMGYVCIVSEQKRARSPRFWFLSGAICAVAGLTNPALLPSLLLLATASLLKTHRGLQCRSALLSFILGLLLTYSPWPLRNCHTLAACVLTRTTVGLELWMGNHPGGEGFLEPSLFPTNNPAELADYRKHGEIAYMQYKRHLAFNYIQGHPLTFAHLSGKRALRFWSGSGTRPASRLFFVHASLSSLLGGFGLLVLWKRGYKWECFVAATLLILFPLPYYITHAEFRYRLVLDPLLTALAAPALQYGLAYVRARRAGPAGQAITRTPALAAEANAFDSWA